MMIWHFYCEKRESERQAKSGLGAACCFLLQILPFLNVWELFSNEGRHAMYQTENVGLTEHEVTKISNIGRVQGKFCLKGLQSRRKKRSVSKGYFFVLFVCLFFALLPFFYLLKKFHLTFEERRTF